MFTKGRSIFKSSDARGFLFFLLLTSMVAVLIKLSKEYTQTYIVPITITKLPIDKTVKLINPSIIEFRAQQSGFSLLRNSFNSEVLEIDFNNFDSLSSTKYSYDTERLNTRLTETIAGASDFTDFTSSLITLNVDVLTTKKVAVQVDVQLDFEQGYNTFDAAIIKPDSAAVVGPKSIIDQLNEVRTQKKRIANVTGDVSLMLDLDTLAVYKELKFSTSKFRYQQQVAKYTEGSFSIPITVRGAQEDAIRIFPREVLLYFVASLEEYDTVLPTDFEVLADFSKRNDNEEFVVLRVSRKPDNLRNVRLESKQIKFIVVH